MRKFGAKLLEVLRKGDMVLLALCVLTSVFGIVMVAASTAYDGSSRYVIIQTGALITGILLYLALTAFDIDILAGQRTLLFLFNTAFLAMLLVWGVEGTSGNKSWLHFPFLPFNIQPAEVCKITYIIILAKTMSLNRNRISSLRSVGTLTFHMLWIVALIVVISHDTGVALIFMFLFVVMAYVGGVSGWWFLGGAGAVAAVSPYLWKYFIRDDQKQRILALIDPSIDPDGLGVLWQTNKSLEALRNGGLTGQGLFHGDLTSIVHWRAARHARLPCRPVPAAGHRPALHPGRHEIPGLYEPPHLHRHRLDAAVPDPHQRRRLPWPVSGRRSGPAVFELRRQLHPDVVPRHGHRLRHQNAPRPRYERTLYPALLTRIFRQHRVLSSTA